MTIDLTGLTEVPFSKRSKVGGSYYLDSSGTLAARTCTRCQEVISADSFSKRSGRSYGRNGECKECVSIRRKAEYADDPERFLGYTRNHREANPGYDQAKKREEYGYNRQRTDEEVLADQARVRPKGTKRCGRCKIVFPLPAFYVDRTKKDGLSYRCKECSIQGTRERYRRPYLLHWTRSGIPLVCYVCGEDWDHSDHVIPSTLGGIDDPENRLPMCEHHNTSKNGTPLLKWLHSTHPELSQQVMQRVFDYGVDPWTKDDIVWRQTDA